VDHCGGHNFSGRRIVFTLIVAIVVALIGAGAAHAFAVRRENARLREDRKRDLERENREKQRVADAGRRELLGLLKLVHVEIVNNLDLLKGMGPPGTLLRGTEKLKRGPDTLEAPKLSSDAWEQSRMRIAALLEDEDLLKHLIAGYAALTALKNRLLNPDTDKLNEREHEEAVRKIESHLWLAFDVCQKETGMFWAWSKGMLVSKPAEELAEAEAALPQTSDGAPRRLLGSGPEE
jgi:hypothetical protein